MTLTRSRFSLRLGICQRSVELLLGVPGFGIGQEDTGAQKSMKYCPAGISALKSYLEPVTLPLRNAGHWLVSADAGTANATTATAARMMMLFSLLIADPSSVLSLSVAGRALGTGPRSPCDPSGPASPVRLDNAEGGQAKKRAERVQSEAFTSRQDLGRFSRVGRAVTLGERYARHPSVGSGFAHMYHGLGDPATSDRFNRRPCLCPSRAPRPGAASPRPTQTARLSVTWETAPFRASNNRGSPTRTEGLLSSPARSGRSRTRARPPARGRGRRACAGSGSRAS